MESADGNLHIVFNGEIYDYKELRAELETFGISFCTHSDTEVLVNTLQQYGEKALDKLRGMFGFAVWNEKESVRVLDAISRFLSHGKIITTEEAHEKC